MRGFCGATVLAAAFWLSPATAVTTVNFGHGFSANSLHHQAAEEFRDAVESKSNGEIKVNLFHSGQLGSAREMFEGLQLGTQQITWVPTARISGFAPQLQLFDLPFLFNDMQQLETALDSDIGASLLDSLTPQGVTGIGFYIDGFKAMTANKALRTPDDFKGLKFRTMESEIIMSTYKSLGANPVPMDYAEVYNGLQMKVIDGQENPIVLIYDMKFYEVQKHLTISHHAVLAGVLVYGKDWFASLPEAQQTVLREAGLHMIKRQRALAAETESKNLEAIKAHGVEVLALSNDEKAALREKTRPVLEKFAQEHGSEYIDAIRKMQEN